MSIWGALAGGFVGTLLLSSILVAASELGWTRMDIPFLLGTAVSAHRHRARAIGFLMHVGFGLAFSLIYFWIFVSIGRGGWLLGALLGVVHALFAGAALVNILLPAVHPRMGTAYTAADSSPYLESPGFMLLNYGRSTPVFTVLSHALYGAVIGGFAAMKG